MPRIDFEGKAESQLALRETPLHLLVARDGAPLALGRDNLLIQGDNLLALRALSAVMPRSVRFIYADPPYNTGNTTWVYNDRVEAAIMRKWVDRTVGPDDMERSDKWCCMMWPRLEAMHRMLTDDGVIALSIDDAELATLLMLMDEIFGRAQRVAVIAWQRAYATKNSALTVSPVHEYIVVYCKTAEHLRVNRLPRTEKADSQYKNPDGDPRGPWQSGDYAKAATRTERPNGWYAITNPNTGEECWPSETRVWAFIQSEHEKNVADNRLWWGKDGKSSTPRYKRFLSEVPDLVVPSLWLHELAGHNDEAKKEIRAIFGEGEVYFDTPKPTRLIRQLLTAFSDPGDLVLDPFAGSGTTGHAVLQMNAEAPDAPARRFILVEMEEAIERDITSVRLDRVIAGYDASADKHVNGLGGAYRRATLSAPLLDADEEATGAPYAALASAVAAWERDDDLVLDADGPCVAQGVEVVVFLYALTHDRMLDDTTLDGVLAAAAGRRAVVYANACTCDPERMRAERVTFRQLPYDLPFLP